MYLNGNERLAPGVDIGHESAVDDCRRLLAQIFAATTKVAAIREPAATIMIALAPLLLPAAVLAAVIGAAFPNVKQTQTSALVRVFSKRADQHRQAAAARTSSNV